MPVRLTPPSDAAIPTKRVSMPDWDTEGPYAEWVSILVFLRKETLESAQKAGRRTIVEGSRPREELNEKAYLLALFGMQVTGWRLLDPAGKEIPYTPENKAALPWDVSAWLHEQILACGGAIATRDLVIAPEGGVRPLDYKSPDAGVGTEQGGEVPASG